MRDDGSLDRTALGRIVFADPAALRDLEAIVHPAVRPRILAAIAAADEADADVVVIEAIKLVEGGLAELCDEVWLVTCEPEAQRERLVGSGRIPGRCGTAYRHPGRDRRSDPTRRDSNDRYIRGSRRRRVRFVESAPRRGAGTAAEPDRTPVRFVRGLVDFG